MPPGWKRLVALIIIRDGGRCWLCGELGADTADHVIPRSKGGSDDPTNLRAAHIACNNRRGNHDVKKALPRVSRFV